MENIREYYLSEYKTDDLGLEINKTSTFDGLLEVLNNRGDVYEYIGVGDSLVRERCFDRLTEIVGTDYQTIYKKWLDS